MRFEPTKKLILENWSTALPTELSDPTKFSVKTFRYNKSKILSKNTLCTQFLRSVYHCEVFAFMYSFQNLKGVDPRKTRKSISLHTVPPCPPDPLFPLLRRSCNYSLQSRRILKEDPPIFSVLQFPTKQSESIFL